MSKPYPVRATGPDLKRILLATVAILALGAQASGAFAQEATGNEVDAVVEVVGDGPEAGPGPVEVHYVGVSWQKKRQFDASWDRGDTFKFTLGRGAHEPFFRPSQVDVRRCDCMEME